MAPSPARKTVPLGPGTLTIGTQPFDFSCEVRGASITHEYDSEDNETMLCGTVVAGATTRQDGLTFETYSDLTAEGLYKYVMDHDLDTVPFVFTPNTDVGAKWQGSLQLRLPDEIGADAYGEPIAAEYEWPGIGEFTFTPATAAPPAGGS